ncbi:MAG TPA: PASTA domain-containing protein [Conexibacter sp.]
MARKSVRADAVAGSDVAMMGVAMPASVPDGGVGVFIFTLSGAATITDHVTVTDMVPDGLRVIGAAIPLGRCSIAGQKVTCFTLGGTDGAQLMIAVTADGGPGTYDDTATVSTASDPNPANNTASVQLTVVPPPTTPAPSCTTVDLRGVPLAAARRVLAALHLKVGAVIKQASRTVARGLVLSTRPGSGATLPNGSVVRLAVSSGASERRPRHLRRVVGSSNSARRAG